MAKIKILIGGVGLNHSFNTGQIVEVNKSNADILYAKVRHGTAVLIEEESKKKDLGEGRGQSEDTNIRHDAQTKRKSRKRVDTSEGSGVL